MDAALKVFALKGFSGTSIKDIAREADISQGLLYHYFPGKVALLVATIEHNSFLPQLRRALKTRSDQPAEVVLKLLSMRFLSMLDEKKLLINILVREISSNAEVNSAWLSLCNEGMSILKQFISERIHTGELKQHNAEVTARCLFSMIFMYQFTTNGFGSETVSRKGFINEALDNLFSGIRER